MSVGIAETFIDKSRQAQYALFPQIDKRHAVLYEPFRARSGRHRRREGMGGGVGGLLRCKSDTEKASLIQAIEFSRFACV